MTDTILSDILTRHERDVLDHLDRQAAVPLVEFARQGDVIVIPARIIDPGVEPESAVPAEGVDVVRAENGGNAHVLVAEGDVRYDLLTSGGLGVDDPAPRLRIGALRVGEGARAFLIHPEHGAVGLVPGLYAVSRQREDDEIERFVQD